MIKNAVLENLNYKDINYFHKNTFVRWIDSLLVTGSEGDSDTGQEGEIEREKKWSIY